MDTKQHGSETEPDGWAWLIHKIQKHYPWVTDELFKKLSILRVFQMYDCAKFEEREQHKRELYGPLVNAWVSAQSEKPLISFLQDFGKGYWPRPKAEEIVLQRKQEIDDTFTNLGLALGGVDLRAALGRTLQSPPGKK